MNRFEKEQALIYFAGLAMQALIASANGSDKSVIENSYEFARSMLKEHGKVVKDLKLRIEDMPEDNLKCD